MGAGKTATMKLELWAYRTQWECPLMSDYYLPPIVWHISPCSRIILTINTIYFFMNTPTNFKNTSHASERDYEALLLAHGLVDTIEKHNGNVQFVISAKGVETLCRIGTAVLPMMAPDLNRRETAPKEENNTDKLISKGEVKRMLNVCDTTLWTWAKRNYLVPVKIGTRINYRLGDVKRIM